MTIDWARAWPAMTASFLASVVEFVEALTVILAVGTVRGWRGSLTGAGGALLILLALVALMGSALTRVPLEALKAFVGALLLLFGLRWLRKAVLRSAGVIPLHDEAAAFAKESEAMRSRGAAGARWDRIAIATSFKIVMLEGIEVVFIVIGVGAGRAGLLVPAGVGALAALAIVAALGLVVHRPLARVPENTLKFTVGVLLSAFGTFWVGEGIGISWFGGDRALVALTCGFLIAALATAAGCRKHGRGVASTAA